MLEFPEFYKVGVASSGDHDFRMEKAWWPEMYMGWPVDSTYHRVSNVTMAGNLKGKLLLTHGGIDENVNPSATFKLAEALVKANKQFDMLIFPSQRHGYQGEVSQYFMMKRWNYFVEHLLGIEPLWEE
ncbi:MAG: S9 family peptidase [Cyclobacteriaceae bacterium]|nr:S9 family peptidase [Cyclobacteriaceae bacterium]